MRFVVNGNKKAQVSDEDQKRRRHDDASAAGAGEGQAHGDASTSHEPGREQDIDGGTTIKSDAEMAAQLERYRRQVGLYASVVARATGQNVTAVLMQL